jgi:Fe-S-cluster-containing hydrogenase component 2
MRIVTMDLKKCVGCRNCEYACSYNRNGQCDSKQSNIQVNYYPEENVCVPLTCLHCKEAWCLNVCPAGAISRDEVSNAVIIDESKCAGCKMCMLACPFGNIHFDTAKQVSRKCNLCDDVEPNCVKHCIAEALNYEDEDELTGNRKAFDGTIMRAITEGGEK